MLCSVVSYVRLEISCGQRASVKKSQLISTVIIVKFWVQSECHETNLCFYNTPPGARIVHW